MKKETMNDQPPLIPKGGYSDIAVVGMGGVFPGACDIDTFWKNIINKVDTSSEVPEDRWIAPKERVYHPVYAPDKAISKRACLIRNFVFDSSEIDIDPEILKALDPLYHILLHAGREALSNVSSINKERTGVVLAAIALPTEMSSFVSREIPGRFFKNKLFGEHERSAMLTRNQALGARVTSLPGSILAQAFGLKCGSFTLDAACASSIYALGFACDELRSYRADAMLAGGVSRPDCLYTQIGFSQLRALSPSGRCAPFDKTADGLVVGEGAGILILKRIEDAIRDNDHIYGIIRGIGFSNDMRGNLLAPDTEGQVRAMREAYESAGWSPQDVDLIECHGAGTPVGDHTELVSLRTLWESPHFVGIKGGCPIGSVKSMIGHLLTAAGAAGMIKVLLAMKHKILPPSNNFSQPHQNSPLIGSPFRVQTMPEEWKKRDENTPRRAAVSAFGFGGINAHLLFEEMNDQPPFPPKGGMRGVIKSHQSSIINHHSDIAIVGMDAAFGSLNGLKDFQEAIFNGRTIISKRPESRWKGADEIATQHLDRRANFGAFTPFPPNGGMMGVSPGEFHIPPNEIPDILPQQLLMLKVAAGAMTDTGNKRLEIRNKKQENSFPRMGAIIGIEFDYAATDFHLRWSIHESCHSALTPTRTLGALGSIVASRISREFRFGGPSFTVSCEAASGLKALEIGIRLLQENKLDAVLIGAVDIAGDIRNVVISDKIRRYSSKQEVYPFDRAADGALPGEGACAIVIKRLDDAKANRDRIYAKINPSILKDRAINGVSYVEAFGSGDQVQDAEEVKELHNIFGQRSEPCAVGSLIPTIGYTGAATGLAAVVKTALCLYHQIIPPLRNFTEPSDPLWHKHTFHIPHFPQFWLRDRKDGPRKAMTSTMTTDGVFMNVILEELTPHAPLSLKIEGGLGEFPAGLFAVEGNEISDLIKQLDELESMLSSGNSIHHTARSWYLQHRLNAGMKYGLSIVANDISTLKKRIMRAKDVVSYESRTENGLDGIAFSPNPLGNNSELAFVFPGSGNHYVGMGRDIGVRWPQVLREMDEETLQLKTQMIPHCYVPWDVLWTPGWEKRAMERIISDPLHMIFGQVVHGSVITRLIKRFGVQPHAVIGYSLGESAGYFAMGVWTEREEMLKRMTNTDLFRNQLAGSCLSARKAWNITPDEDFNWCVAVINRPAHVVKDVIRKFIHTRLLIINTPDECVIGGRKQQIHAVIKTLGCQAIFLDGVVTVHCDAVLPAAMDYKNLHVFPTTQPEGIRFYSCAFGRVIDLTPENAASSILKQAISGFDFPAVIEQAYKDGVRIFIDMGPQSSMKRMIDRILTTKPHLSVCACSRGEEDHLTIFKCLGTLIAERVPVNLEMLYGGSSKLTPQPPSIFQIEEDKGVEFYSALIPGLTQIAQETAKAHEMFLEFSNEITRDFADTFALQTQLLGYQNSEDSSRLSVVSGQKSTDHCSPTTDHLFTVAAFSREMCIEFAIGSVEKVLGPEFADVDTYHVRVRLPDEPLMLVDRILSIEGEKGSMGSGRIVTEHDVLPGAWYLDGGRAPVCISVEAGQADLFLCSYLGIDLKVKGKRAYRLLDATVTFHRGLPQANDVIRYEIEIERFARQGETWLFFFNFEGFIGDSHLITMTKGCAGFFTEEEVRNSGGIILTPEDTAQVQGKKSYDDLIPVQTESYNDQQVEKLRNGDLAGCFGSLFKNINISESLRLPGGQMRLIDRILILDPTGGRYGLGLIKAEADIHPNDWFLTCHFMDDMVMPGTLMYECCAHALRVLLQRMGWVSERSDVCYEPVIGVPAKLKCRGPVTPKTKRVIYEVEIAEIGYNPEPYVIADAHMYADGHQIVMFKGMSMKMTGMSRSELELTPFIPLSLKREGRVSFDRRHILAFAEGNPSEAFGEAYRIFDKERVIARLPRPPYSFIDRIISAEPPAMVLKPDGWVQAEYDVSPDDWYFRADRTQSMPFCILLEIALQVCGWLAAYMGSALKSKKDLKFRNLGGDAILYENILCSPSILTMRCRLTQVSEAADMIIENFDMEVLNAGKKIYEGTTYFGFFTAEALSNQVGIRGAENTAYKPSHKEIETGKAFVFENSAPLSPDDPNTDSAESLSMPAKALLMIDEIEIYIKDGGPHGLGFIRGIKRVDPDEWFFKAHFYQDPVCPGSLGVESFLQLIKYIAIDRWGHLRNKHRFEIITGKRHQWIYRGQIIQKNKKVEVEAFVTDIQDKPVPTIFADGYLKADGLYIYQMQNFGIRIVN